MSEKKTKESASKSRQSENQVTRVLLIVTFTFLVLVGFQCISQCFYMLMPKEVRQTEGSERDGHTERGGGRADKGGQRVGGGGRQREWGGSRQREGQRGGQTGGGGGRQREGQTERGADREGGAVSEREGADRERGAGWGGSNMMQ